MRHISSAYKSNRKASLIKNITPIYQLVYIFQIFMGVSAGVQRNLLTCNDTSHSHHSSKMLEITARTTAVTSFIEYYMDHQVSEKEARKTLSLMMDQDKDFDNKKPVPYCEKCTEQIEKYCLGPLFLKDHCCCDFRHAIDKLSFIPHSCYASEDQCQPSSIVGNSCSNYDETRECCCDQLLKRTSTPRKGEICNACVLLVKRFKRLPPGSERHWGHVVDARVGPGLKSMTKFKKRKDDSKESNDGKNNKQSMTVSSNQNNKLEKNGISSVPERFCKIFKKTKKKTNANANLKVKHKKKDIDTSGSDGESSPNSPISSISDGESSMGIPENDNISKNCTKYKRKNYHPFKNKRKLDETQIFDTENWMTKETCCGIVYENSMINAVIIDLCQHQPCKEHSCLAKKRNSNIETIGSHFESELNINCNTDDLLIKLTDEQIQENIENASHTGFNKISKVSDLFNTNTTAFKKHHLYSKRGNSTIGNILVSSNGTDNKKTISAINKTEIIKSTNGNGSNAILQKKMDTESNEKDVLHNIKSDNSGKVTKTSNGDKLSAIKLKTLDFNVKNLVKLCTEKSIRLNNKNEIIKGSVENGNKIYGKFMSDNSSDSGYEETLEAQNLMQKQNTAMCPAITKPVVLPNGIKLHVQPQNLLLAANLAGISQPSVMSQAANNGVSATSTVICVSNTPKKIDLVMNTLEKCIPDSTPTNEPQSALTSTTQVVIKPVSKTN
uniref:CSON002924 protein n=1 Tax=Culicoides sonorensis TaxID=179676 RepID=A0A336LJA1_CULSO